MTWPPVRCASPPCSADAADPSYAGHLAPEEAVAELDALRAAMERLGAPAEATASLSQALHRLAGSATGRSATSDGMRHPSLEACALALEGIMPRIADDAIHALLAEARTILRQRQL